MRGSLPGGCSLILHVTQGKGALNGKKQFVHRETKKPNIIQMNSLSHLPARPPLFPFLEATPITAWRASVWKFSQSVLKTRGQIVSHLLSV